MPLHTPAPAFAIVEPMRSKATPVLASSPIALVVVLLAGCGGEGPEGPAAADGSTSGEGSTSPTVAADTTFSNQPIVFPPID